MSLQELEVLYCFCGHSEEDHYGEPMGDESPKIPCQAGNNDGSLCRCDDFTLPNEPEEWEPNCYRCERDAVNCECVKGFAYDERDLY